MNSDHLAAVMIAALLVAFLTIFKIFDSRIERRKSGAAFNTTKAGPSPKGKNMSKKALKEEQQRLSNRIIYLQAFFDGEIGNFDSLTAENRAAKRLEMAGMKTQLTAIDLQIAL